MNSLFFRFDEYAVFSAQLLSTDSHPSKFHSLGHTQFAAFKFYVLTLAELQKLGEHLLQLLDVSGCEQKIVHIFMNLIEALVSHTAISNMVKEV